MKKVQPKYEYLLQILHLLELFLISNGYEPKYIPSIYVFILKIVVIYIKYIKEGLRINFIIFSISEGAIILFEIMNDIHMVNLKMIYILSVTFFVLYIISTQMMPIYIVQKATGPFNTGKREISLEDYKFSVYYPTSQNAQIQKVEWCNQQQQDQLQKQYKKFTQLDLPKLFLNLMFQHTTKQCIHTISNAKYLSQQERSIVMFIGDINSIENQYSFIISDLVSHGYIVFYLHNKIHFEHQILKIHQSLHQEFVKDKMYQISILMSVLKNEFSKLYMNFIRSKDINLHNISFIGHQLGGLVNLQIIQSNNIQTIGSFICLDTSLNNLSSSQLCFDVKNRLIFLQSELAILEQQSRESINTCDKTLNLINYQDNKQNVKTYLVKEAGDINFTDLQFIMPIEHFTRICSTDQIEETVDTIRHSLLIFLNANDNSFNLIDSNLLKNSRIQIPQNSFEKYA